jgi:hypothetical protein
VRASISACGFAVKSSARKRRCPTVRALPTIRGCNMQHATYNIQRRCPTVRALPTWLQHATFGMRHTTHDGAAPPSVPQWLGWRKPVGPQHGAASVRRFTAYRSFEETAQSSSRELPRLWSTAVRTNSCRQTAQTLWADRSNRSLHSGARRAFCSLPSLYPIVPSRRIRRC